MLFIRLIPILLLIDFSNTLFVPDQLPTLLSFLYSNIPPVKKGTDSRVGLGFRVGPNADFQVMLELGPQQRTQPIGPDANNNNKRETYEKETVNSGTWLEKWKLQQTQDKDAENLVEFPVVDQDIVNHLHQLYKPKKPDQFEDTEE